MQLPFSTECLLCLQHTQVTELICKDCYLDLPHLHSACKCCAIPLPDTPSNNSCGACQKAPPHYDRCQAAFTYEFPIDALTNRYKNSQSTALAKPLANLLFRRLDSGSPRPDLLVPVPIHKTKLKQRGFNHAAALSQRLSKLTGIPSIPLLNKVKPTADQKALGQKARKINLQSAFSINERLLEKFRHQCQHVVIIDDVITTGSTADHLAALLKHVGIKVVDVWAIARTDKSHHQIETGYSREP